MSAACKSGGMGNKSPACEMSDKASVAIAALRNSDDARIATALLITSFNAACRCPASVAARIARASSRYAFHNRSCPAASASSARAWLSSRGPQSCQHRDQRHHQHRDQYQRHRGIRSQHLNTGDWLVFSLHAKIQTCSGACNSKRMPPRPRRFHGYDLA